jgi:hypothetical protein
VRAAPLQGYNAKINVSAPTRIDWFFPAANQSPAKPPAKFIGDDYDSTKQSYELFVPPRKDMKQPLPAVLFISAGDDSQGWKSFEVPCKQLGFVYIGVRGAGNSVPTPKRSRIVLDCFDDVRKQIPLDPDRTYIAGLSGGGRMACGIGFALPEYFGGIIPVVAGGELRDEPWLRHRAIDRLSVALITGTTDFNRGEIEKWRGPLWKDVGIRTRIWTLNMGHTIPPAANLLEAIKWLEENKDKRAALAKKFPAMRSSSDGVASREESAKALLQEGKEKLKARASLHGGLMLLKGCLERWPDLPQAADAKKILLVYEAKKEKPWEADDIAEQLKYMTAEARALGDYALQGISPMSQYARQRPDFAKKAIELWKQVIAAAPDSAAATDGEKRVPELEKLAAGK